MKVPAVNAIKNHMQRKRTVLRWANRSRLVWRQHIFTHHSHVHDGGVGQQRLRLDHIGVFGAHRALAATRHQRTAGTGRGGTEGKDRGAPIARKSRGLVARSPNNTMRAALRAPVRVAASTPRSVRLPPTPRRTIATATAAPSRPSSAFSFIGPAHSPSYFPSVRAPFFTPSTSLPSRPSFENFWMPAVPATSPFNVRIPPLERDTPTKEVPVRVCASFSSSPCAGCSRE